MTVDEKIKEISRKCRGCQNLIGAVDCLLTNNIELIMQRSTNNSPISILENLEEHLALLHEDFVSAYHNLEPFCLVDFVYEEREVGDENDT